MSLEKIYFALWIRRKLGKKEFLKLYIVLLRAELNCTIYGSQMGQLAGASLVATWKANVRFQKFFFPSFCIHSKSKIFFSQRHVLSTPFLSKNSRGELHASRKVGNEFPHMSEEKEHQRAFQSTLFARNTTFFKWHSILLHWSPYDGIERDYSKSPL